MPRALERQDIQVLFSVLPGGASLYLGFMAHEGNCHSFSLQKLFWLPPCSLPKRHVGAMDIFPSSLVSRKLGEKGKSWDEEEKCWDEEEERFSHFGRGNQNSALHFQVFVCGFCGQPRVMELCLAVLLPTSILKATCGDEIHPITCPGLLQGGIQGQMQLRDISAGHHPLYSLGLSAPN